MIMMTARRLWPPGSDLDRQTNVLCEILFRPKVGRICSFRLDLNSRLPIDPLRFCPQSRGTQLRLNHDEQAG
jgi:hypothetical protein